MPGAKPWPVLPPDGKDGSRRAHPDRAAHCLPAGAAGLPAGSRYRLLAFGGRLPDRDGLANFIGLGNCGEALPDPALWRAAWFSLRFALLAATAQVLIGLTLAIFLAPILNRYPWLMALLMLPMMVAPALVGLMYRLILHEFVGDAVLSTLAREQPVLPVTSSGLPNLSKMSTAINPHCLITYRCAMTKSVRPGSPYTSDSQQVRQCGKLKELH